jgi:hypothetical protein
MIGLRYNNQQLYLPPDFSIDFLLEDDIFDPSSIGQGYSWPIILTREGNEDIFNFAGNPAVRKNGFQIYDGFEITMGGNLWLPVSFELLEADEKIYRGNISTVNSTVFDALGASIIDLLDEAGSTFQQRTGVDIWDHTIADNVVFPIISFYDDVKNLHVLHNYEGSIRHSTVPDPLYLPCFPVKYILLEIFNYLGVNYRNEYSATGDDPEKLIMWSNQTLLDISVATPVAGYVPDITLAELLTSVIGGTAATTRAEKNTFLNISSIDRLMKNKAVDLSRKTFATEVKKADPVTDISFKWKTDDRLLKDLPKKKLEGNFVGTYDTVALFEASAPATDDYAFIRKYNCYFKFFITKAYHYGEALQNYINPNAKKTLELKLVPPRLDDHQYHEIEGDIQITDNAGKVRLTGPTLGESKSYGTYPYSLTEYYHLSMSSMPSEMLLLNQGGKEADQELYLKEYEDITSVIFDPSGGIIDTNIDFIEARDIKKMISKGGGWNIQFPVLGTKPNAEQRVGYISFFHGRQSTSDGGIISRGSTDDTSGETTFAFASPSCLAPDLTKIGGTALRFFEENNLIDTTWKLFFSLLKNTRKLVMKNCTLSSVDIQQTWKKRKARNNQATFIPSKISGRLTRRGIEDQEIEGYRV